MLHVVALAYGMNLGVLTLVGLVGIVDPPCEGVKAAIEEVMRSGVHVAMITGDSKETAIAVAKELNFFHRDSITLSYKDVHDLSETELSDWIENHRGCILQNVSRAQDQDNRGLLEERET